MIELSGPEIVTAIIFLVSCIATLLKFIQGVFSDTKKKVKEMEVLHATQNEHVIDLTGKVSRLEGEREGFLSGVNKASAEAAVNVEKMSAEVIAAVKELKNND